MARRRLASFAAAGLVAACAATPTATTVSPGVPVDSGAMASAGRTILVSWRQTLPGPGKSDVYLFAPGDPAGACHAATTAAGIRFHCEGHAGWIVVTGFDPGAPHEVAVSLMRASGRSGLVVTQAGRALPASQATVPGAPQVPAGGRLRVQLSGAGTLEALTVRELD